MRIERHYWPVWVLVIAMFAVWLAWGLVYNKTSPFASPMIAVPLFYLSGFFSVTLTVATFSTLLRIAFLPQHTLAEHVNAAVRQGLIIGITVTILMLFQQFRILTVWIAGMIVSMAFLVEAFFWEGGEEIPEDQTED